jgi:2',3'-cyclic-nucleotide 2'-phosphodiesterase (5'-nucleotidase family)
VALGKLRYDAWTPGERELAYGPEVVRQLATASGAAVVSANLADGEGRLLFKPSVIKTIGKLKVGITGVTTGDFGQAADTTVAPALRALKYNDTVASLTPVVAELRKSCDAVILLAHMRAPEARRLARPRGVRRAVGKRRRRRSAPTVARPLHRCAFSSA